MISKYSTFPVFEARCKKVILWLRLFCIGLVVFAIATEILISRTVGPGSYLEELHNQLFFAIMNSILTPLVIIRFFYGNSNESGWLTTGGHVPRSDPLFISSIPLPDFQRLARPAKRDARKKQSRSHQPSELDTQSHPRTWHFDTGRLVHRNFRRERPHCGKNYKHYPQHHPFR